MYKSSGSAMDRAYNLWLPSTDSKSLLSYTSEYSPDYWANVKDPWHDPSSLCPTLLHKDAISVMQTMGLNLSTSSPNSGKRALLLDR